MARTSTWQKVQDLILFGSVKFQRRFKDTNHEIVINDSPQLFQRILICVSDDTATIGELETFILKLKEKYSNVQIDAIISKDRSSHYTSNAQFDTILSFDKKSLSLFGFPAKDIITTINNNNYDVVIDCHNPLHLPIAYLIGKSNIATRISPKNKHASYFYNIEIVAQKNALFPIVLRMLSIL